MNAEAVSEQQLPFPGGDRRRDVFDLPMLRLPSPVRGNVSRSVQRRIQRKCAMVGRVNKAILALNSLFFGGSKIFESKQVDSLEGLPLVQQDVIRSLQQRVQFLGPPPEGISCSGALSALRATSGSYLDCEAGVGEVVPMSLDSLFLPKGKVAGVNLLEHFTGADLEVISNYEEYMMHDASVWTNLQDQAGLLKPYDDPSLRNKKQYLKFLKHLFSCGVLGFSKVCKGRVGAFSVSKKPKIINGVLTPRQRLVLDCRQTNLLFKPPPTTSLGSLSALGEVELQGEEQLFIAGADICDCFYACDVPAGLEAYFCLKFDLSRHEASWVSGQPTSDFEGWSRISPCVKVLPMGFNWSFYLVQALHENISLNTLGISRNCLVLDGSPAPKLAEHDVLLMPYCDNVHCLGTSGRQAQTAKDAVCEGLERAGFELHEDVGACTYFPTLGGVVDGKLGQVRASNKRIWYLLYAFEYLTYAKVSYKLVQQLLGHAMVVCVLNRSGMSVFRALYDYVQQGGPARKLNSSEVWECNVFIGLLPLLFVDMRKEWSEVVTCTDASPSGFGICQRELPTGEIRKMGRWQERWRFKRLPVSEWKPRERWKGRDPFSDPFTTIGSLDTYDDLENFTPNDEFPEVPSNVLNPSEWSTMKMGRWKDTSEHITLKEGRAVVLALRRMTRNSRYRGKKHLILVDNLALGFALGKGRSSNFAMLRVLQQVAALSLASGIQLRPRWIPSEFNVADGPSRGQKRPGSYSPEWKANTQVQSSYASSHKWQSPASQVVAESVEGQAYDATKDPKEGHQDFGKPRGQNPQTTPAKACSTPTASGGERWQARSGEQTDLAGDAECERRSSAPIRGLLQQVQGLLRGERHPMATITRRGRCSDGRLLGCSLPGGKDSSRGREVSGSVRVPSLRLQRAPAQKQKRTQRLEKIGSTTESTSFSKAGDVWNSYDHGQQEREKQSAHDPGRFRSLPTSWGSSGPERTEHSKSGQGSRETVPMGHSDHTGSGGKKTRQNRHLRQQLGSQQQGDKVAGGHPHSTGQETGQPRHQPVLVQHGRVSEKFCGGREKAGPGRAAPLPAATRRCHGGPLQRPSRSQCSEGQGSVEDRSKCEALRQDRQSAATTQQNVRQPGSILSVGRKEHVPSHGREDGSSKSGIALFPDVLACRKLPKRFVLEIFAGSARVTQTLREKGLHAYPIDTCLFPSHNVLHPQVAHNICHLLQSQRVMLVWLGMPCTTFSRARRFDGLGPGPLRDISNLWGLPGLSRQDQRKLTDGNALFWFTLRILKLCAALSIPFVLENPLTSMVWELPPLQQFIQRTNAKYCDLDFCQYGEKWKKPTRLLYHGIDLSILSKRCVSNNNICSRTNRPHLPLKGRDHSGTFWTLRAQPYPFALADAFAQQLLCLDEL